MAVNGNEPGRDRVESEQFWSAKHRAVDDIGLFMRKIRPTLMNSPG
jgi:hypothetical protein